MSVPKIRCTVAIALALLASVAAAADDGCLDGSFEGTLGTATVSLEFRPDFGRDGMVGRYYYDRRLADLLLLADEEDPARWQERDPAGQVTGAWQFDCTGDHLGGRWTSPDGRRSLTLAATRSGAFDQRRLDALTPLATPRTDGQGHRYEALTVAGVPDIVSLRLPAALPGAARINAQLFAGLREDVGRALECGSYGRARGADAGWSHHSEVTIAAWFEEAVSLRQSSEGYCGGAHPYGDTGYRSFRLADGEAFHPSAWLADDYPTTIDRRSPLGVELKRRYLAERGADDAECFEALDFFPDFVALDPTGLRFPSSAAWVSRPCEEDVVIEFDALQPFLSAAGRQAIARLRTAAGSARH